MVINEKSSEFSVIELYALTRGPGINVKDVVGDELQVTGWVMFSEGEGERARVVLSLQTPVGIYRTISPTFKESFMDIVTNFFKRPVIRVLAGTSKQGRGYVDCLLVGNTDEGGESRG